jgi:hypothetical protein
VVSAEAAKVAALTAERLQCPMKFIETLGGVGDAVKLCDHDATVFWYMQHAINTVADALKSFPDEREEFKRALTEFTKQVVAHGLNVRYLRPKKSALKGLFG